MDKSTYKAARRAIFVNSLQLLADGLYGLRMTANDEADFAEMLEDSDNLIDVELEDEGFED